MFHNNKKTKLSPSHKMPMKNKDKREEKKHYFKISLQCQLKRTKLNGY